MPVQDVEPELPISILDTDVGDSLQSIPQITLTAWRYIQLYKLTMQQAVLEHYPTVTARYQFTNRNKSNKFTREAFEWIRGMIMKLGQLQLTSDERSWLETTCPYFKPAYLEYLSQFRFNPSEQVILKFVPDEADGNHGHIQLSIHGLWVESILYEVPVMSIISQGYFRTIDTKWDYVGQRKNAFLKAKKLMAAGCIFTEFGTRRRRTYLSQKIVMQGLLDANNQFKTDGNYKGKLSGTSNVHFAQVFGVQPIGTIAHEWTMGIAAIEGYEGSNGLALDKWNATYPGGQLDIALTDTFSSRVFFEDFVQNLDRAKRWRGLRQDSGDPKAFAKHAVAIYKQLGIDPKTKVIVFSDGLSPELCLELQRYSEEIGVSCSFGIGTNFTNDFKQIAHPHEQTIEDIGSGEPADSSLADSKALNIVIKLWQIGNEPCVKISDELTKNSGDPEAIKMIKERFGMET